MYCRGCLGGEMRVYNVNSSEQFSYKRNDYKKSGGIKRKKEKMFI